MNSKNDTFQTTGFRAISRLRRVLHGGVLAILLVLFAPSAHAQAQGIALWKRTASHPQTHFFEYREFSHQGQVTHFRLMNGETQELTLFQRVAFTDYFHMPDSIPPETGSRIFMPYLAKYRQFLQQCPETGAALRPRIKELEDALRRMERGEVRQDGAWASRGAYESAQAAVADRKREEQARENRRQARNKEVSTEEPLPSPTFIRRLRQQQENKRRRTR